MATYAEFDTVRCRWGLWDGALRWIEDQSEIDNNVLFLVLTYGIYTTSFSGKDFYYFNEDDTGWTAMVWTDPTQPYAIPENVGRKLRFSKTSSELFSETLIETPGLTAHEGILVPDEIWESL